MYLFLVKFKRKVPLDFWKSFAVLDAYVFMFIYRNFILYGTLSFVEFYDYRFEFDRYILVEKKRKKNKPDWAGLLAEVFEKYLNEGNKRYE